MPSLSHEEQRRLTGLPKQSSKSTIGPWLTEVAQRVPETSKGDALDDAFIVTIEKIERLSTDMSKQIKIRIEAWCKKLCQVHANEVFLRNRNAHAELLLSCCLSDNFTEPFNRMPPGGPLASLPQHVTCMIKQRHLEHRLECAREQSRRATGSAQAQEQYCDTPNRYSRIENEFSPSRVIDLRESHENLQLSGAFDKLTKSPGHAPKSPRNLDGSSHGGNRLPPLRKSGEQIQIRRGSPLRRSGELIDSAPPSRGNSPMITLPDRNAIDRNKFEWTDRELKKVSIDNKRLRASLRAYRETNTQLNAQILALKEENTALKSQQAATAFQSVREGRGARHFRRASQSRSPSRSQSIDRQHACSPYGSRVPYNRRPLPITNPDLPEPPDPHDHDDPEIFLNYLSRFQAYTTSLLASSPKRRKEARSHAIAPAASTIPVHEESHASFSMDMMMESVPPAAPSPAKSQFRGLSIDSSASRLVNLIDNNLDSLNKTGQTHSPSFHAHALYTGA